MQAFVPLSCECSHSDKVFVPVDGETQAGLQWGYPRTQFMPPMLEPFFDPAAVECKMPHWDCSGPPQRVKKRRGKFVRNGQFPAQLADKAQTCGTACNRCDLGGARVAEGQIGQIAQSGQQSPAAGTHHANRAKSLGYI